MLSCDAVGAASSSTGVGKLPAPGDRIADKYEVVRVVGEGGMGVVYEVIHSRLQQRAAIKMLLPRVQAMPDVVARFEREARAACRLRSRHAVRITDVDHDELGRAYMVMEYLDGHDLAYELHLRGRLPVAEAVDVVLQACAAMAEAHASGVVHRDLKPSNLYLVKEGGESIVKVLDFGISKLAGEGEAHITSTFATMGTPLYMSPEQVRSAKNVDARTDIWALGVILFETIAGERPFQGTTTAAAAAIVADPAPLLRTLEPSAPEALEAIVSKTLAKRPDDRYQDVRALAEALSPFGITRDALRAIDAALGAPQRDGSIRPPGKRPASTPSFVHAETMAQTTPPPMRIVTAPRTQRSEDALLVGAPSGVSGRSAPAPPATDAGWESQRTGAKRLQRTGSWVGLVIGLMVLGYVMLRRGGDDASHAPTPATVSATMTPTTPPTPTATATPTPTPTPTATATATASPPASATPAVPSPRHAHHAAPPNAGSSPPPPQTPTPPTAPATSTNPIHL
jgi:serine/threonine-protein kinase